MSSKNVSNKDADQLCGHRTADQPFYFCYIDSTISLHVLPKSEISSLKPSSVPVQPSLCHPKDRFSHEAAQIIEVSSKHWGFQSVTQSRCPWQALEAVELTSTQCTFLRGAP